MIEVFADVVCPFTYVGLERLLARRHELGSTAILRVRAWPLELVNGRALAPALVAEEVQELREQVAPDLFAGFDPDRVPSTSLPALALTAAAYRQGMSVGEHVSFALRQALFEEGRDIAAAEVLTDIARAHDVPAVDAADRAAVLADWDEGRRRGVEGSPHFFVGSESFFCPSLEITRIGEHLRITRDSAGFEAFSSAAFANA